MEPFLESSLTPLFLTHAISKLLANAIGKMYRLYFKHIPNQTTSPHLHGYSPGPSHHYVLHGHLKQYKLILKVDCN